MSELAKFLLARIAEEEERAKKLQERAGQHRVTVREPRLLGREIPGWHDWTEVQALAARMLAECDVKRRLLVAAAQANTMWQILGNDSLGGYLIAARDTVKIITLPYADHPDYRREWTP